MSKGQRIKIIDSYEKVFFLNIGTYLEIINGYLSDKYEPRPLSEHIKIVGGYAFKSAEYKKSGIPIIRISDFNNEKVILDNVKYYNEDISLERYELKSGDIIIAQTGGTIGKLAVVQDNLGKIYLNQRVGKFEIINPNDFEKEYIYWIARGLQEKIKGLAWGGAQPNVSGKQIEAMLFPIPSKNIQKEIIRFLNDLRNGKTESRKYFDKNIEAKLVRLQDNQMRVLKIENNSIGQRECIQKLRQSILQDAIEGKLTVDWRKKNLNVEPASELFKKIKAEKEKLIAEKKRKKEKPLPEILKEEVPFDLPKGWEWTRLGEIGQALIGLTYRPDQINETGTSVLRSNNIIENKLDYNSLVKVKGEIPKSKIAEIGDILICARNGSKRLIGKAAIIEKEHMAFGAFMSLFKSKFNKYVFYFLLSNVFRAQIDDEKSTGINQLTQGILLNTIFPFPPPPEQKAIVRKVETLMQKLDKLEVEISQNQKTADMLMQAVLKEAFEK